jgi:hypothetical protein
MAFQLLSDILFDPSTGKASDFVKPYIVAHAGTGCAGNQKRMLIWAVI